MHKRIKELEKLSIEIVNCGLNGTSTAERFNREKFAELIIKECAYIAARNQAENMGWDISEIIKEHFGLK